MGATGFSGKWCFAWHTMCGVLFVILLSFRVSVVKVFVDYDGVYMFNVCFNMVAVYSVSFVSMFVVHSMSSNVS